MSKFLLRFLIICGLPLAAVAGEPSIKKPNILFCVADDWSYGHASIYGDPVVKTPKTGPTRPAFHRR